MPQRRLSELKVGESAILDGRHFKVTERASEDRASGSTHVKFSNGAREIFVWDNENPRVFEIDAPEPAPGDKTTKDWKELIPWDDYPKFADAFLHRPAVNIYWGELCRLLNAVYEMGQKSRDEGKEPMAVPEAVPFLLRCPVTGREHRWIEESARPFMYECQDCPALMRSK